ncbi:MAG: DNA repair protein RecN [Proteobacteria bacterium]|nr:DNA repair protein RecN [Pseudomonadota bacterium]
MLVSLSVHDIVLIDRLDVTFERGLCVLTGETGAGKSILLDALGLALGNRAEAGLLRPGASQASVAAAFEIEADHPVRAILADQGLEAEDGLLVLRRRLGADGRSRAFVNDQPVSAGLLRRLGDALVEIQGQFEQRGLLDPASHRALLDASGGLGTQAERVAVLWRDWRAAAEARERAARELAAARRDEAFLRHAVEELEAFDPAPGEERSLAERRALLMNAEKLAEAMNAASAALSGDDGRPGAESALAEARRVLDRAAGPAAGRLGPALAAVERAALETEEALAALRSLSAALDLESGRLAEVEDRLFALRDLARKHGIETDALPGLRATLAERLAAIEGGGERLAEVERAVEEKRAAYAAEAEALSRARAKAAKSLDRAVNLELGPLKLERASFRTRIERQEEAGWGAHGVDRIAFEVSTNPGSPHGALGKIASGGELSRFLLALKVVLAEVGPLRTLVFDEVDSNVGGATAHAVGERLERLSRDRPKGHPGGHPGGRQVLVVTHSPQVGARGAHHWRVHKEAHGDRVATRVSPLNLDEREEEIARMLSGAEVTEEARAAARRLIEADTR